MGKTSMAIVHAMTAAEFGFKVYIQSYEMSTEGVTRTILSQSSKINRRDFKDGSALSNPFLNKTISKIENYPITIDESSQNVIQLRAILTTIKMTEGLDMFVLDYLQLMPSAGKFGTTADEIGFNSRALKRIAKELDITVIALAQLSRGVEIRGGQKKPSLSDLKGSGDIEQDADIVLFPYRPAYYNATDDTGQAIPENYAEYILAKQREGGLDDIPVGWDGSKTLYYDTSEAEVPETFESLKPTNPVQPPDDGF
jgi:replicative DNA helicase